MTFSGIGPLVLQTPLHAPSGMTGSDRGKSIENGMNFVPRNAVSSEHSQTSRQRYESIYGEKQECERPDPFRSGKGRAYAGTVCIQHEEFSSPNEEIPDVQVVMPQSRVVELRHKPADPFQETSQFPGGERLPGQELMHGVCALDLRSHQPSGSGPTKVRNRERTPHGALSQSEEVFEFASRRISKPPKSLESFDEESGEPPNRPPGVLFDDLPLRRRRTPPPHPPLERGQDSPPLSARFEQDRLLCLRHLSRGGKTGVRCNRRSRKEQEFAVVRPLW